jgi:hypothetical protein
MVNWQREVRELRNQD